MLKCKEAGRAFDILLSSLSQNKQQNFENLFWKTNHVRSKSDMGAECQSISSLTFCALSLSLIGKPKPCLKAHSPKFPSKNPTPRIALSVGSLADVFYPI